jgi:hypothetical protein
MTRVIACRFEELSSQRVIRLSKHVAVSQSCSPVTTEESRFLRDYAKPQQPCVGICNP